MAILKKFILAKSKEEAKSLFSGGTTIDENGKEITADKGSIIFVAKSDQEIIEAVDAVINKALEETY